METTYYITINIKVPNGMMELGRLFLGSDKSRAAESFAQLHGDYPGAAHAVLRLDLIEHNAHTDFPLEQMSVTLEQLEYNFRSIAVDAFKYFSLEP